MAARIRAACSSSRHNATPDLIRGGVVLRIWLFRSYIIKCWKKVNPSLTHYLSFELQYSVIY